MNRDFGGNVFSVLIKNGLKLKINEVKQILLEPRTKLYAQCSTMPRKVSLTYCLKTAVINRFIYQKERIKTMKIIESGGVAFRRIGMSFGL